MDDLLRLSMSAPVPTPSADFDQRVLRQIRAEQSSPTLDRFRRLLFAGYAVVSVAASAVILRSEHLDWAMTAAAIAAPLALIAIATPVWRATHSATRAAAG
jgi:hypothetical protein